MIRVGLLCDSLQYASPDRAHRSRCNVMKRSSTLAVLITASLAVVTAMGADAPNGMSMPGMQMAGVASAQRGKLGHTTGKVVRIDAAHSRITIAHHPVPALGWPAMTMTFQATTLQLQGLQAGDQVDFQFYLHDGAAVIERIHRIG